MDTAKRYMGPLLEASIKRNPLKMAIVTYNAYRDVGRAREMQINLPKKFKIYAQNAIDRMVISLRKMGWEEKEIKEFLIKSKELAGIDNEEQNEI